MSTLCAKLRWRIQSRYWSYGAFSNGAKLQALNAACRTSSTATQARPELCHTIFIFVYIQHSQGVRCFLKYYSPLLTFVSNCLHVKIIVCIGKPLYQRIECFADVKLLIAHVSRIIYISSGVTLGVWTAQSICRNLSIWSPLLPSLRTLLRNIR